MAMNVELCRLRSFNRWPEEVPPLPISYQTLAKAGFYATEEPAVVKCHFCGVIINNWTDVVEITETHLGLSSGCLFLYQPERTNNCRIYNGVELQNERIRLSTFVNWPVSFVSPEALAQSGLFYTHHADEVQCAWCGGVIGGWEVGDDPFTEHAHFFPSCQKVIANSISSDPIPDSSIGIQPVQLPHMPEYSSLDSRIRTFEKWTMGHVQDPARLSEAGFFYLGLADEVRCFHCDGGLRFWLVDDDPWFEHARCFPKCQFVQLVKGQQFIENVQTQIQQSSAQQKQQQHLVQSRSSANTVVPSMSLEDALNTEPVQLALQMGLNVGRIWAATKHRLETLGNPFPTSQELVEAVLDGQIEEQDLEPTTSSRMGRRLENELTQWISTAITSSLVAAQQPAAPLADGPEAQAHSVPDGTLPHSAKTSDKSESRPVSPSATSSVPESHNSATSKVLTDEAALRLEEENKRLKDARECKICMSDEVGIVFCPCGHLVSCVQCAPAVIKCPVCRAVIKARVRTFLS